MKNLFFTSARNQYLFQNKIKYLDFCMSNGAMILGHSSNIYKETLKKHSYIGSNYSFENIYNINYTKAILKKFSFLKEIKFCNSGSEANIRALRILRTITNKKKFIMMNGSWHGSVDSFMFDLNKNKKTKELGGKSFSKKDMILIEYNNYEKSIELIKKYKNQVCGIFIEPIQASCPTKRSEDYVKNIFKYCKKNNIYIVFDEIITGLRLKKLTFFNKYNLKPDIVTFAKIFGGGSPIGLCCYNNNIKMQLDKPKNKVFFGGTFSGNPLSSNLGLNTFNFLLKNSKKINQHINSISEYIVKKINHYSAEKSIEFKMQNYESIIRPIFSSKTILNKLDREKNDPYLVKSKALRDYLVKNKIFIGGNCNFFISYSHTKKNADDLIKKILLYLKKSS